MKSSIQSICQQKEVVKDYVIDHATETQLCRKEMAHKVGHQAAIICRFVSDKNDMQAKDAAVAAISLAGGIVKIEQNGFVLL